jgi:hypothetical protein
LSPISIFSHPPFLKGSQGGFLRLVNILHAILLENSL